MSHLDYGIFDCDTHCYEPRDAFTRFLPEAYLDRALTPVKLANGQEAILAGSRIATFNSESGLGFDMAYRPGSLKEMLRQMGSGNPEESYQPEPVRAEIMTATEQGIEIVTTDQANAAATSAGLSQAEADAVTADYADAQLDALRNAMFAVALLALLSIMFTRRLPSKPTTAGGPD